MSVFEFVLASLAVWRVAHLLSSEDGPFALLAKLRRRLGDGHWGNLMDCPKCLSIWLAIAPAMLLAASWTERVITWLAMSAVAVLTEAAITRLDVGVFQEEDH